ncbi:unnamed protein product [Debaryomyces fabryi]|nr:unnamed protein product [Debaryomyces fabryi]
MAEVRKVDERSSLIDKTENLLGVQIEGDEYSLSPTVKQSSYIFSLVDNFLWIELSLLTNVFLSGFDGTVAASIYTTIGNEFGAMNLASWITTSYLITSTAFQPLYGSFSDIIGRRKCVIFAVVCFLLGCIGCSIAKSMLMLNLMRAFTGIGGGGLITLSTIINSDIVTPEKRGLFQAFQNLLLGFGAICGASLGGYISLTLGWRWCFIIQIFPAMISIIITFKNIPNQPGFNDSSHTSMENIFSKIDIKGSIILVSALTFQLFVLTLGGNILAWNDYRLICLGISGISLLFYFLYVECNTTANPIIPINKFKGLFPICLIGFNFLIGLAGYAYLFILPLLFQIELGDTPSKAGFRLIFPALSTPIGGIIAGVTMAKFNCLRPLVYSGSFIMSLGNFLALLINKNTKSWLLNLLLMPANIGQGLAYPSSLFTFIFAYGTSNQATSTSMVYLMRSIGGVWGVAGVSAIVQLVTNNRVSKDLHKLGLLSNDEINKILDDLKRSTEAAFDLPDNIRWIVLQDYESAIKIAQAVSAVCCAIAFLLFLLSDILKTKPTTVIQ